MPGPAQDSDAPSAANDAPSIGTGKPLSIRLLSMYPGKEAARATLVSTAVKSASTHDEAPVAMNYLIDYEDHTWGQLISPNAEKKGSNIVFYSPAVLDDTLQVQVRYSFDSFDADKIRDYIQAATSVAGLPVFALGTAIGGPAGGPIAQALLYGAGKAAKIITNIIEQNENRDMPDWRAGGTISFDLVQTGLEETGGGYFLLTDDNENRPMERIAPTGASLDEEQWSGCSTIYRVDRRFGHLVDVESNQTVTGDIRYALVYLSGKKNPQLESWKPTAVAAALQKQFFTDVSGVKPDQFVELLSNFNDVVMAKRYAEKLAVLDDATVPEQERSRAETDRDSYLLHIQDEVFRKMISDKR